ncbi:MAG: CRISPR-associated helicase Cas3' [Eubacteriales bacterium]
MGFIAHIREDDNKIQTVEEHLLESKILAEFYGEKLQISHLTGLAALLHDLGKYTNAFKNYILEAVEHPDSPPPRGSVDHSTAGGKLLYEKFHSKKTDPYKVLVAEIVGNAIISHHSYLNDFLGPELESNFLNRVRDKQLDEFDLAKTSFFMYVISEEELSNYIDIAALELKKAIETDINNYEKQVMFLTKYVFSSLIDADRTNTRLFEENKQNEQNELRNIDALFNKYYEKIMIKVNSFKIDENAKHPINILRNSMSEQCDKFAEKPSGIYTLSIPTGGGKTLASLRYALKHGKLFNKNKIIFVVPYTTIIEQNADEIRKVLGDDVNVLEHHSNVIDDDYDNENDDGVINKRYKLQLAKDNWDSPIIFTTMVQFLNVFYAKGTRNIRRLHNLSNSIIVFDEVQKVPVKCVSLFNMAINFLKNKCNSSILLCTATQPALDYVEHKLEINTDGEIIQGLGDVVKAFTRVKIIDRASNESFNNEKLKDFIQEKIKEVQSILIILNTRSVVKRLYEILKENNSNIPIYHLSTNMCGAHRSYILDKVKQHIYLNEKVICVSTQLIEAGVDISFKCVIRSLSGLDSIAQAAGRCNRNGESAISNVYVIDHEEENISKLKEIKVGKQISKKILVDMKKDSSEYDGDLLSLKAMEKYFQEFYSTFTSNLNYSIPKLQKNMIDLLTESTRKHNSYYYAFKINKGESLQLIVANSYMTAAENFRVIDNNTTSVIVPYGEGKDIITQFNSSDRVKDFTRLLQKSQQYTINLWESELSDLDTNKGLVRYLDGKILALKESSYDMEYGLNVKNYSRVDSYIY